MYVYTSKKFVNHRNLVNSINDRRIVFLFCNCNIPSVEQSRLEIAYQYQHVAISPFCLLIFLFAKNF